MHDLRKLMFAAVSCGVLALGLSAAGGNLPGVGELGGPGRNLLPGEFLH